MLLDLPWPSRSKWIQMNQKVVMLRYLMNSLFLVLFWPLNCGVWGSRCRRSAGSKGRKQMEDTYFFGWGWQYWGFIHEKFTFNGYHIYERRSHGICNRQPWSNDIWMNLITTSRRFLSLEWWLILDNTNPKWTYFSGGLIIHTIRIPIHTLTLQFRWTRWQTTHLGQRRLEFTQRVSMFTT